MDDYRERYAQVKTVPMTEAEHLALRKRLMHPDHPVDVVLDTDTYNEIDDQYALAYLVKNSDKLRLKAIYAAPFWNSKSESPADGMERSYREMENILTLMERRDLLEIAHRGSTEYLRDEQTPVVSDAAEDLARRAMAYTPEDPLYVIAIGAITNVASALLMEPAIRDRVVIVWLGGHALHWHDNAEFNLMQDIAAARVVLGCGAAVVLLPCMGVVSAFTTSGPELRHWLAGKNKLCDYLCDVTAKEATRKNPVSTWTRPIWDVTAVAWLLDGKFMEDTIIPSPIPEYGFRWAQDPRRHPVKYVYHINRDRLFEDLFKKLSQQD